MSGRDDGLSAPAQPTLCGVQPLGGPRRPWPQRQARLPFYFPALGGLIHVQQPGHVEDHSRRFSWLLRLLQTGVVGWVWPHGSGGSEDTRDLSGYSSSFPGELPTPGLLVSGQVLAGTMSSLGR